jgi:hypothetical protein
MTILFENRRLLQLKKSGRTNEPRFSKNQHSTGFLLLPLLSPAKGYGMAARLMHGSVPSILSNQQKRPLRQLLLLLEPRQLPPPSEGRRRGKGISESRSESETNREEAGEKGEREEET